MVLVACQNTFSQAYQATFGLSENPTVVFFDFIVEFLFLLDIIFTFFQEYKDEERVVREMRLIAFRYMKGSLFFDLAAIIPFDLIKPLFHYKPS